MYSMELHLISHLHILALIYQSVLYIYNLHNLNIIQHSHLQLLGLHLNPS